MGRVERPKLYKLQFREDPRRHFVLSKITELYPSQFSQRLNSRLNKCDAKQAFVFVHGFKTTFQQAVWRAAQISADLQFDGISAVFSWPTQGRWGPTTGPYRHDETNAEPAIIYCKQFLDNLIKSTGIEKLHLIAHSMGNKVLSYALKEMVASKDAQDGPTFNQVILAAPDIDADAFRDVIAPSIQGIAERTTLYASGADRALAISRKLHGKHRRAGYAKGGITIAEGVDTVDASKVNISFLGHWVATESRAVMDDLYYLLCQGMPPWQRHLQPVPVRGATKYYRFSP